MICRYLVSAEEGCAEFAAVGDYPAALGDGGRVGDLATDPRDSLTPVSHPVPLVDAPDTGSMCIEMTSGSRDTAVSSALFGVSEKYRTPVPLQEYVFTEQQDTSFR